MLNKNWLLFFVVILVGPLCLGQKSTFVDNQGVFRWVKDSSEIRLFGTNYTLPFAHGFRAINYIGKDHKKAIDDDVYHMTRLGLDAFRIHVWDAEVSDSLGNLLQTEQLDLLDYTISKMKERGVKTILTPFKVGDNGYPEKNFPVPGFSNSLSKSETYSNEANLVKQERYFDQFLNHVNPYTGLAYKNDPDIVALEINNEPTHDNGDIATKYINRMVEVIRNTGFKNPIFYNVSERSEFIEDYCRANIQGCTFQWYPTGLVYNKELKGNYLPNVDVYQVPFEDIKNFKNKTRIIYEFDPADMSSSYLYPAMARSFRESKFQFAAQFAYDPLELAYANTEYQTHYLNLAYTPSKAISLMIASQVFHEMSNGQSYGRYPENTTFGNTRLDSKKDLAEYNSKDNFYYTNSTESQPISIDDLKRIAGVGNSSIIKYSGTGAYFLDKIERGLWRLEVMPNVLWVNDPFGKPSLKKLVAVVKWDKESMEVNIEDLGHEFDVIPIDQGNGYAPEVKASKFSVLPGTYLLRSKKLKFEIDTEKQLKNIKLNEFVAPSENIEKIYVVHKPQQQISNNQDLFINAKILAPSEIIKAEIVLPSGYHQTDNYEMVKKDAFNYEAKIPREYLNDDSFRYYIVVHTIDGSKTFPKDIDGSPEDWDFISDERYETRVVRNVPIVVLFDANEGIENSIWPTQYNAVKYEVKLISGKFYTERTLRLSVDNLNFKIPDMTFKLLVGDKIKPRQSTSEKISQIMIKASSGTKAKQKVQIAFQLKDGSIFGKIIELNRSNETLTIDFQELNRVKQVLLPRPYPVFQPYWFESNDKGDFDPEEIEVIQISIGPDLTKEQQLENQQIEIDKIWLE